jgi:hypothetical protein
MHFFFIIGTGVHAYDMSDLYNAWCGHTQARWIWYGCFFVLSLQVREQKIYVLIRFWSTAPHVVMVKYFPALMFWVENQTDCNFLPVFKAAQYPCSCWNSSHTVRVKWWRCHPYYWKYNRIFLHALSALYSWDPRWWTFSALSTNWQLMKSVKLKHDICRLFFIWYVI